MGVEGRIGLPTSPPHIQPPLARHLFNIQRHANFNEILERYEGAKFLTAGLAEKSLKDDFNIEAELRRLSEHTDDQTRQNFKHIPAYLRDLLHQASYSYVDSPSNYQILVSELLAEKCHDVLFLVMNYDTLLESAIASYNRDLSFMHLDDYIDKGRSAKVVKLHGSCDWFLTITPKVNSWAESVEKFEVPSGVREEEIRINKTITNVRDDRIDRDWV